MQIKVCHNVILVRELLEAHRLMRNRILANNRGIVLFQQFSDVICKVIVLFLQVLNAELKQTFFAGVFDFQP